MKLLSNRTEAGERLADRLAASAIERPIVLALPRGGVPVAAPIAARLLAPLDLLMVAKIGLPQQPELALGAIVDGDPPQIVVNGPVARCHGYDEAAISELSVPAYEKLKSRRVLYLGSRPPPEVEGRSVVVVDDGIATGATMRAALKGLGRNAPRRLVLAVPVAPAATLDELRNAAQPIECTIECLETPDPFLAVGNAYADFAPVADETVVALLERAGR